MRILGAIRRGWQRIQRSRTSSIPTGNPGTGTRPPDEIITLLRSIDGRLHKLERCIDDDNHQKRMCVRTGHWNS